MKFLYAATLGAAFAVQQVAGHATWQDLWVAGVDEQASCVRLPQSNSPVVDVTSTSLRCNLNNGAVAGKCKVAAGGIVTAEMHQQPGDRSCANEAIGGAHYGPVLAYMTKVSDATTADGSTGWFKVFQDSWAKISGSANGAADNWGTKDLNVCCGRMNIKIPSDIAPGDYLLRVEAIALHAAQSLGGAQFYMSCFQLTVTGAGTATPSTVVFPGAYSATDPGIEIDIYSPLSTYVVPGPAVYSGGTTKSAGASCSGAETITTTGPAYTQSSGAATTSASGGSSAGTTLTTSSKPASSTTSTTKSTSSTASTSSAATSSAASGGGAGCSVAKYGQCGGTGWTGCTVCASGSTCSAVSPPYYYQCT